MIGKEIPKVQEPLIDKTIKFKSKYEGQRELDFGKFYQMYTIPIVVDYEVIAVICFEINYEDTQTRGFTRLLKTAFIILENAPKKQIIKCIEQFLHEMGLSLQIKMNALFLLIW